MPHSPKIQKIVAFLAKEIKEGRLKEGNKIPSEYTLSDMFAVHKSTANRAVATLVERGILKRCLGGAGTVVQKRPEAHISIVIPLSGIPSFVVKILDGAQSAAFKNGFFLDYFPWPSGEDSGFFWRTLASSSTKGLLVYGASPPVAMPFPVVHICATPDYSDSNWVVTDDFLGGRLVCEHLFSMGHKDVVFVSFHFGCATIKRRADGFLSALAERRVDKPGKRIFLPALNYENFSAVMEQVMSSFPSATAFAFDQDPVAAKALLFFKKKGVRVPEDFSVTGYGCVPECHHAARMTSVEQFPAHMGHMAAETLLSLLEDPALAPVRKCLPVELVQGETVKRI